VALFKRERRSPSPQEAPRTAADEFQHLFLNAGRQRQQLLVITVLSLVLSLVLLVSYINLAHASRFVPYLYVVDRAGEVLALGGAKPLPADTDTVVYQAVASFITGLRVVYLDPDAQRTALSSAFNHIQETPGATTFAYLNTYLTDHDPREIAKQSTRSVEITSVVKLPSRAAVPGKPKSTNTWKVNWRETTYPTSGLGTRSISEWEAFLLVRVTPKKVIEGFDPNPFGIWVDGLSWNRITPERPL
jgi:type IV secretory pathway TrbF-like protein